jgi:hypothetical protein
MPNYLLLYRSEESSQDQMSQSTPEEMEAELALWEAWGARVGDRLVDFGAPCADTDGIGGSLVGGYSIVSAGSSQELAVILDGHPHLPFGTIQSLELLDVPGM